jgi:hypothetical protein
MGGMLPSQATAETPVGRLRLGAGSLRRRFQSRPVRCAGLGRRRSGPLRVLAVVPRTGSLALATWVPTISSPSFHWLGPVCFVASRGGDRHLPDARERSVNRFALTMTASIPSDENGASSRFWTIAHEYTVELGPVSISPRR